MLHLDLPPAREDGYRILCLGAHADDVEIGAGGTVLAWLRDHPESSVRWVVFSASGTRADEAEASAQRLLCGVGEWEVDVASFEDGFFPEQWAAIKRYFERRIKPFEPDLILTHYRHDRHQDHRTISDLTWNTFRDHLILEYEIPKYDGDLGQPNLFVPLDRALCEQKVDHLMTAFPSQTERSWFTEETFWSMLRLRGIEAAAPYAEAFYAHKLVGRTGDTAGADGRTDG